MSRQTLLFDLAMQYAEWLLRVDLRGGDVILAEDGNQADEIIPVF
jgi:hypothetical protein